MKPKGSADHSDETTRADIARAAATLDDAAHKTLHAGRKDDQAAWDEHLCYVTTEGR